ncbi:MAG: hypothetical protein KJN71_05945 [Acidimicrobiia bacterium]|nr:hypothetical protein [Acidimicrobiia bacterium]
MFSRPLSDRIHRPLAVAVLWSWLVLAAATVIIATTSLVGWGVSYVVSWFGSVTPGFPWEVAYGMAAVLAPFLLAATAYAASYASAERNMVLRALVGTMTGVVALIVLVRAGRPIAVFGALTVAWAFAAPFEHWGRAVLRLLVPSALIAFGLWLEATTWLQLALVAAISPVAAAITVWIGDMVWVWIRASVIEPEDTPVKPGTG